MSILEMSFQPNSEARWQAEAMEARVKNEEAQRQATYRAKQAGEVIDAEFEVIQPAKGISHDQG